MRISTMIVITVTVSLFMIVTFNQSASAQANCGKFSTSRKRAWCYQQQANSYRQQSKTYKNIARKQYRQHKKIGQALRRTPYIGKRAQRAWNYPRYYYNYKYGRP